jgi:hypothetical protein
MNRRVATVPTPNRLRPPAALRLPTRQKIAEQNFEVAIQTEFQFEIRHWLVTSTLSYVALQTASRSKFPPETRGWRERSRDDIGRGNMSANRGGMESGNGQTAWCHTDKRAAIQHGSSSWLKIILFGIIVQIAAPSQMYVIIPGFVSAK